MKEQTKYMLLALGGVAVVGLVLLGGAGMPALADAPMDNGDQGDSSGGGSNLDLGGFVPFSFNNVGERQALRLNLSFDMPAALTLSQPRMLQGVVACGCGDQLEALGGFFNSLGAGISDAWQNFDGG